VARLADYGWTFDLQVFTAQMPHAVQLVDACPRVTFVLQHAGMLEDLTDQGRDAWRAAMADLARRPNAVVKLSGFGTFLHRSDPDHVRWLVTETVALFGAGRCLWGSNFPIEKLWTDYAGLLSAHRSAAGGLSDAETRAIFNDTAARVYRL
jgi:predicted TIM-barrel fold metal-dependent hydrolase